MHVQTGSNVTTTMSRKRIIIMGAAGRDFHNFNLCFREDPTCEVVAFTATQIPYIHDRIYPPELSGPLYPKGIPIYPEDKLASLIRDKEIDEVVFAYSDISYEYLMHRAAFVNALGANFTLVGVEKTMLQSKRPVLSVCAVRTGCGKSGVTRLICRILRERGKRVAVIRHPMPYGDLIKQKAQRFVTRDDIARCECSIEELEEFEPLVNDGFTVYSGVDQAEVLIMAEEEGEIIVWDGGNNDTPFIKADIEIVVLDPHRQGDEVSFYPAETNLLRADILIINKINTAKREDIKRLKENIKATNSEATVLYTTSEINVDNPGRLKGKRVLVIEDGPTLTHGGMRFGAGIIAAERYETVIVDPRPYAAGSIRDTLKRYPSIDRLIPALGYSKEQLNDLEDTINSTPCDVVLIATPVDLTRILKIEKPAIRVEYEVVETEPARLGCIIDRFLSSKK